MKGQPILSDDEIKGKMDLISWDNRTLIVETFSIRNGPFSRLQQKAISIQKRITKNEKSGSIVLALFP